MSEPDLSLAQFQRDLLVFFCWALSVNLLITDSKKSQLLLQPRGFQCVSDLSLVLNTYLAACETPLLALLYYEYIITFEAEVSRIWERSRFNTSIMIFFLNRYVALFGHIPIVLEFFWTTSEINLKGKVSHLVFRFPEGLCRAFPS